MLVVKTSKGRTPSLKTLTKRWESHYLDSYGQNTVSFKETHFHGNSNRRWLSPPMRLSQNSSLIGNLTGGRGFNYDSGHQLYNKKTLRIDDINEAQTLKARGLRGYQSIYFRIFLVKIFYQLFFFLGKRKVTL